MTRRRIREEATAEHPDRAARWWSPLDGSGASPADVGGKAAALDRLVAVGAPVPRAAAVSVGAYRAFVVAGGLEPVLARLPRLVDPARLAEDAEEAEAAFVDAPMAPELWRAIRDAYDHASGGGLVAVRSSATAEDLVAASFAGQYRSFLGVGPGGLERAVRLCWASLWAPGARVYRSAHGLDDLGVAMGVVVQRMVPAERSGVVFTVDPTEAEERVLRVEVVEGLGERLVSGEAIPDVFQVRRTDLVVEQPGAPAFLPELTRLALSIEEAFGRPQDIEWSVAGGRVHILQARPITATATAPGDGFDTRPPEGATFTAAGVVEMLPGVLSPLLWTVNAPMLEEAFGALYGALGIHPPSSLGPMVGRYRGRAALNLSLLKAAAAHMPGGSAAEVERQYLGRVATVEQQARPRGSRLARVLPTWRALRLRKRVVRDAAVFSEAVHLAIGLNPDRTSLSTTALVAYRRGVRDLARFGMRTEVAAAAAAAANYRGLELALERWVGPDEASVAAQRLTAGSVREQAGGCAAVLSLWDVHCDHCQLPDVAAAVYDGPIEETEARLASLGPHGRAFLDVVHEGLRSAGSAALYGGPTWEEDRNSFWAVLRQCRGLHPDQGPPTRMAEAAAAGGEYLVALERRIARTWTWRMTRVLTGQIVDIRRRLLRRMVQDAATFLRLRESLKSGVLRVGGEERRVTKELARRLVAAGVLAREGDEWFVADDELERLVRGQPGPDETTVVARRVAFEAMLEAPPLPEIFSGLPGADTDEHLPEESVLRGWATSPGRVVGTARVVRDLTEARLLTAGEILVSRSTDPSWTPLFLTAAAIVMEQGGPLSHAAIVAREFRLPAVLNVKGATRRIRSGMTLAVDGTRGIVEIIAEQSSDEREVQVA